MRDGRRARKDSREYDLLQPGKTGERGVYGEKLRGAGIYGRFYVREGDGGQGTLPAEGKAEILLKLLGYRGSVPELLRGRIQAERDHERLDAWLECALESGSVEEFARKCGVCG